MSMALPNFFGVDAAPAPIVAARRAGFARLAALFADRYRQTLEKTAELAGSVSDLNLLPATACRFNSAVTCGSI